MTPDGTVVTLGVVAGGDVVVSIAFEALVLEHAASRQTKATRTEHPPRVLMGLFVSHNSDRTRLAAALSTGQFAERSPQMPKRCCCVHLDQAEGLRAALPA